MLWALTTLTVVVKGAPDTVTVSCVRANGDTATERSRRALVKSIFAVVAVVVVQLTFFLSLVSSLRMIEDGLTGLCEMDIIASDLDYLSYTERNRPTD